MDFHFTLCDTCLPKYKALVFDPSATHVCVLMPFGAIAWLDEHPKGPPVSHYDEDSNQFYDLECHEQCRDSIIRLVAARTALWRVGLIPSESEKFWQEAEKLLPEWPGFRRLSLSQDQYRALNNCSDELGDFMEAIDEDFPEIEATDEGGGLTSFRATRRIQAEPPAAKKNKHWWQFWTIKRLLLGNMEHKDGG